LKKLIEDAMDNRYDMEELVSQGVDDKVASEVEQYFSYNFNLEDHCDVQELVNDKLDDMLDDMVQEKVEEILREKLSSATITFN
jgi:DNA-binding protein Fis